MADIAAALDRTLKAAGVLITGVSIGTPADKTTWTVNPSSLQSAAQPIIDAFNPNDPAWEQAEIDAAANRELDDARLAGALLWVLLRSVFPSDTVAQTKTKFNAANGAKAQAKAAYLARPWL